MNLPRPEFPNPQWERENWLCLNGQWQFDFDFGRSALERKLYQQDSLPRKIMVPFCPESKLSGIEYTDFLPAVVYLKKITMNRKQLENQVILHFGAVDYLAVVYVNGQEVCSHKGGYTPFEADITDALIEGENSIFVYAEDDTRSALQCSGKQSSCYYSFGCSYTRTTGIWQSVWLEFVPKIHLLSAKYEADIDNGILTVTGKTSGLGTVEVSAEYDGQPVGNGSSYSNGDFCVSVPLSRVERWEAGCGRLYDLTLRLGEDCVKSYFGMRRAGLDGMRFFLNGKPLFQRLVLDQGFYPDGIYTAPTEAELIRDIQLSMDLGFNGARLHQKVFEPRFLYHCDRMGYLVWDEYPNWGFQCDHPSAAPIFLKEWLEVLARDINHPSIVAWCPFNETEGYSEDMRDNSLPSMVYQVTKAMDRTRPCVDASGYFHTTTDIYDVHDYEQDPEAFAGYYARISEGILMEPCQRGNLPGYKQSYNGAPVIISEYGGTAWNKERAAWGYGNAPETQEEFIRRYQGLTHALLDNSQITGFCYTQLYDVEQEQNGLCTYSRAPKFDPALFREINQKAAAMEEAFELGKIS